jgi:hypothetical protein
MGWGHGFSPWVLTPVPPSKKKERKKEMRNEYGSSKEVKVSDDLHKRSFNEWMEMNACVEWAYR